MDNWYNYGRQYLMRIMHKLTSENQERTSLRLGSLCMIAHEMYITIREEEEEEMKKCIIEYVKRKKSLGEEDELYINKLNASVMLTRENRACEYIEKELMKQMRFQEKGEDDKSYQEYLIFFYNLKYVSERLVYYYFCRMIGDPTFFSYAKEKNYLCY